MSGERRVGKRAEQKRRWDLENRRVCACGELAWHERCDKCRKADVRRERDLRFRAIELAWNDGLSMKEIAALLGTSVNSLSVSFAAMRKEDRWNVPHRYTLDATGRRVAA